MSSTLAECLQSVHFQYDFGGGVQKPIHFVHQSSDGSWRLALPFKRSEIIKYIAGQVGANNTVRFHVSKTQRSFPCMESMLVWFVQQDHNLSQANDNSVSSEVDYETIMSLRNKKPSSDNFNAFLKAVGLDFITVGKVKKIRNADSISVQILGCNLSSANLSANSNFSIDRRNSSVTVNYLWEESYNAYSSFLSGIRHIHFNRHSESNSLTVQLTDMELEENNFDFLLGRIISAIRNEVHSNTRNSIIVDQAKLGQVNRFLYPVKSTMLAQMFCNSVNEVIQSQNLQEYLDPTTMDDWGVNINYKQENMKIDALAYDKFTNVNEVAGIQWLFPIRYVCGQDLIQQVKKAFDHNLMSHYGLANRSMDEWQSNLASRIVNTRVAS